jgi:hypothetical protein
VPNFLARYLLKFPGFFQTLFWIENGMSSALSERQIFNILLRFLFSTLFERLCLEVVTMTKSNNFVIQREKGYENVGFTI